MVTGSKTILSALVYDSKFFSSVFGVLKTTDFDDDYEKTIFKTISESYTKYNKITTFDELELIFATSNFSEEKRDNVQATLLNLKDMPINTVNREILLDSSEKWIKNNRFYYDVILGGADMLDGETTETTESLQMKAQEINKISFKKSTGLDYKADYIENFMEYSKIEDGGIDCKLDLVNIATGKYRAGTLTIYASVSNGGKTTFLVNDAVHTMLQGKNVAYFTFEEKEIEIRERIDGNILGVKTSELKKGPTFLNTKFKKLIDQGIGELKIKQYGPRSASMLDVKAQLEDWRLKDGFVPDIVILDSITIIAPISKSDNLYGVGKAVSEEAKDMSVELDVPVVSAVQFGRSAFSSEKAGMEDVAESIAIMQVASTAIAVTMDEKRPDVRMISIIKSRKVNKSKQTNCIVNIDTDRQTVWDLTDGEKKNITGGMRAQANKISEMNEIGESIENIKDEEHKESIKNTFVPGKRFKKPKLNTTPQSQEKKSDSKYNALDSAMNT